MKKLMLMFGILGVVCIDRANGMDSSNCAIRDYYTEKAPAKQTLRDKELVMAEVKALGERNFSEMCRKLRGYSREKLNDIAARSGKEKVGRLGPRYRAA
ncbi:MAG: hypothetical protein LBF54_04170 [Holosporaceae bacterium]|jgi:hypothetical protein|nr:hypothetical protein [Holosporaceae bacterium]